MEVFRLAEQEHSDLSGVGGMFGSGRWNHRGNLVLYAASSRALACAERLVHESIEVMPPLVMLTLWVPDDAPLRKLTPTELPDDWNLLAPAESTKNIGSAWLKSKEQLILQLPSAVIGGDYNFIINPLHPFHSQIKVMRETPFHYDERLQKIVS